MNDCEPKIPFMITNYHLDKEAGESTVHYYDPTADFDKFSFLKDVYYCGETDRIYGEPLSLEEFKSGVKDLLNKTEYDHVLYSIHGFSVSPHSSYMQSVEFNEAYGDRTGYLVIPINWKNYHQLIKAL